MRSDYLGSFLPFNKIPITVDLTRYLYVSKQITDVKIVAIRNLISAMKLKRNMKNVINVTIGKCTKYIQYEESEIYLEIEL
tara:strand:- start:14 stop:256 length:243 start_codon:yes stop_codon:yes gene_type:complete